MALRKMDDVFNLNFRLFFLQNLPSLDIRNKKFKNTKRTFIHYIVYGSMHIAYSIGASIKLYKRFISIFNLKKNYNRFSFYIIFFKLL